MPGRVAWEFAGYEWPVNPEKDTGWVYDHVETENVPLQAQRSSFQYGGTKSGRRQISGWLYGPGALNHYNNFKAWHRNRIIGTLVDHLGNVSTARVSKFDAEPLASVTEWRQGRVTWRYNAEFTEE